MKVAKSYQVQVGNAASRGLGFTVYNSNDRFFFSYIKAKTTVVSLEYVLLSGSRNKKTLQYTKASVCFFRFWSVGQFYGIMDFTTDSVT